MKRKQYPEGWAVEDTGGGCQWLRKGQIAITDGEVGLPDWGQHCSIVTLDANGSYDESMPLIECPSLEKAFADLNAMERFYGHAPKKILTILASV